MSAVGAKAANELGLYDMSGNLWEWCWDLDGTYRRIRGGCWLESAGACAVSSRSSSTPESRAPNYGLRLARSL
jgi:formylglycine-generating enzyme required for sulfatase activity